MKPNTTRSSNPLYAGFLAALLASNALALPPDFYQHTIDANFGGASSIQSVDLDLDGDMDILGAAYSLNQIAWWENDGRENYTKHIIDGAFNGATSVRAADIDQDGDIDVVGCAQTANEVAWWRNDGGGNWTKVVIESGFTGAQDISIADLDGDGDLDVVGVCTGLDDVTCWENDGTPSDAEWNAFTIDSFLSNPYSVTTGDIDNDGNLDVIASGQSADLIRWYENDGTPFDAGWTTRTVNPALFDGATTVVAMDIDRDGDLDVACAAKTDDVVSWWANDGTPLDGGWVKSDISGVFVGAWSVFAGDIDSDGDVDFVATTRATNRVSWFENDGSQTFIEHILTTNLSGARATVLEDVNGDGQMDILVAAYGANDVIWYRNLTDIPPVPVFTAHTIDGNFDGAIDLVACDLDQDGDMDVVGAGSNAGGIGGEGFAWWENDGSENFTYHSIATGFTGASCVSCADIDGDGDIDVIGSNFAGSWVRYYENDGAESFTVREIDNAYTGPRHHIAFDIDRDGDLDIIASSSSLNDVTWFENDGTPADGAWAEHTIDGAFVGAFFSFPVDMDGDGDIDVVSVANGGDLVYWFENDGSMNFAGHEIDGSLDAARSVVAADLDNDGDIDVVAAGYFANAVTWYENDGSEGFTERNIVTGFDGARQVYLSDMDGDGDLDVVATAYSDNTISWFENDGSPAAGTWNQHNLSTSFTGAYGVFVADMDGDGDMDILGAAYTADDITWWENDQSPTRMPGWAQTIVDGAFGGAHSVYAVDMDGDGDTDILGGAFSDDEIVWWENDGSETFTPETIDNTSTGIRSVYAADIDSDGDMDVVGAWSTDDEISWYENTGVGWTRHNLSTTFTTAWSVFASDINGDGFTDILGAAVGSDKITLWENDGSQNFTPTDVTSTFDGAVSAFAADIDGDGDIDVVGASSIGGEIAWFENDGTESFTEHTITATFAGAFSVFAADVDSDGDLDVLGASFTDGEIAWWENDGTPAVGAWTEHTVNAAFGGAYSVYAADMDGDGDLDILGAAYTDGEFTWWENDGNASDAGWVEHNIAGGFGGAASIYAADMDNDGDVDVFGAAFTANDIVWWENDLNPLGSPRRVKHLIPRNKYALIGIPVNVADGDAVTLFNDDFNGTAVGAPNWAVSRWDHVNQKYVRYGQLDRPNVGGDQDPADFTPGLGYWTRQDAVNNCELDVTAAQQTGVVNQAKRFAVNVNAPLTDPVRRGQIQIANPFNYAYDWRNTWVYDANSDQRLTLYEAAQANWISGYAYRWDSWTEQYVNVNFTGLTAPYMLYPWEGFWFEQLDGARTLQVEFAPQSHKDDFEDVDHQEWRLQITAITLNGEARDEYNFIGADTRSNDGYDFLDAFDFPSMADRPLEIYFPQTDWEYGGGRISSDIRAYNNQDEYQWEFVLSAGSLQNQLVELDIGGCENLAPECTVTLSSADGEIQNVDMRSDEPFLYTVPDEAEHEQRFIVRVTGPVSVEDEPQPGSFELLSAYPNPFNDRMSVSFRMDDVGLATVSLFDLQGRLVDTLVEGKFEAGQHHSFIDASHFASGEYLLQLSTPSAKKTIKVTLLR